MHALECIIFPENVSQRDFSSTLRLICQSFRRAYKCTRRFIIRLKYSSFAFIVGNTKYR